MLNREHKNIGYRPDPPVYNAILKASFYFYYYTIFSINNLFLGGNSFFKNVWFGK